MADEQEYKPSASEKKKEDWMNSKWRPMMGWMYMVVCFMDFVGFPVLWSLLQMISHGNVSSQWQPLTLQGAGLFHIAMGAVIGISAYGRTQEKLGGAAGPTMNFPSNAGTTYTPPSGSAMSSSTSSFGGSSNGFGSTTSSSPAFGAPSTGGFGSPGASCTSASGGFGSSSTSGTSTSGFGGSGGFGGAVSSGCSATPTPTPTPSGIKPVMRKPS